MHDDFDRGGGGEPVEGVAQEDIADMLEARRQEHPVLARLRERLTEGRARPETVITSYDRMHHRHNRS